MKPKKPGRKEVTERLDEQAMERFEEAVFVRKINKQDAFVEALTDWIAGVEATHGNGAAFATIPVMNWPGMFP